LPTRTERTKRQYVCAFPFLRMTLWRKYIPYKKRFLPTVGKTQGWHYIAFLNKNRRTG
jgi:hypothetical protein